MAEHKKSRPLWDGIYDFTWRAYNAKRFIGTVFCMAFLAWGSWGCYGLGIGMVEGIYADARPSDKSGLLPAEVTDNRFTLYASFWTAVPIAQFRLPRIPRIPTIKPVPVPVRPPSVSRPLQLGRPMIGPALRGVGYGTRPLFSGTSPFFISLIVGSLVIGLTTLLSALPAFYFVRIMESTADGEEEIDWRRSSAPKFLDLYLGRRSIMLAIIMRMVVPFFSRELIYWLWICACSAAVPGIALAIVRVVVPFSAVVWWTVLTTGTVILLPIFLLSTLLSNSPLILIHFRLIKNLVQHAAVAGLLYVHTAFFAATCILSAYWMVTIVDQRPVLFFPLTALTGFVWATYWWCYARFLGRVGWFVTNELAR